MNIFYTPPEYIYESTLEIIDQEAHHVSNVLRFNPGDEITVIDGKGGWYEGLIDKILDDKVRVAINKKTTQKRSDPEIVLGIGMLKKRDRTEFAVEKAVELGVSNIILFRSDYTVKENIRIDRLESIVLSAMKQSLRSFRPGIRVFDSVKKLIESRNDYKLLVAHNDETYNEGSTDLSEELTNEKAGLLLLVGPEGGFSKGELKMIKDKGGIFISLGQHRFRSETAAIVLLSRVTALRD